MQRASIRLALFVAILYAQAALSAPLQPIEMTVKNDVLLSQMTADDGGSFTATFTLPELAVFTGSGDPIFLDKGFDENFMELVEVAMQSRSVIPKGKRLPNTLSEMELLAGGALDPALVAAHDFVFVEYWAQWCAPCHLQKKAIANYLESHPKNKILWLYVRRDPTLLPNMQMIDN